MKSYPKIPKIVMLWSGTLLVLGASYGWIVYPRQQAAARLYAEVSRQEKVLAQLQAIRSPAGRDQVTADLRAMEQQYGDMVFTPDQLSQLDFALRGLATDRSLRSFESRNLFSQTDTEFSTFKYLSQQQVWVDAGCEFLDFIRFVNDIERYRPAVFVTGLKFRRDYKDTGNDLPMAHLDLSALREKPRP